MFKAREKMETTAILYIIVTVALVAGAFLLFTKVMGGSEENGSQKAVKKAQRDDGVEKTVAALRRYAATHDFALAAPVVLKNGEKETRLDAVLVTYNGVVGVRCEGRNGQVYANPGDRQWLWVAGDTRESFESPVDQAAADVRMLRECLNDAGVRGAKVVECFTVFTSSRVELAVPKSLAVYRPKSLMARLGGDRYMEDSGFDKIAALQALADAGR